MKWNASVPINDQIIRHKNNKKTKSNKPLQGIASLLMKQVINRPLFESDAFCMTA